MHADYHTLITLHSLQDTDHEARVEEAITRTLICAVKSADHLSTSDSWLNPTEVAFLYFVVVTCHDLYNLLCPVTFSVNYSTNYPVLRGGGGIFLASLQKPNVSLQGHGPCY